MRRSSQTIQEPVSADEIVEIRRGIRKYFVVAVLELIFFSYFVVGFLAVIPMVYLFQAEISLGRGDMDRARAKLWVGKQMAGLGLF